MKLHWNIQIEYEKIEIDIPSNQKLKVNHSYT